MPQRIPRPKRPRVHINRAEPLVRRRRDRTVDSSLLRVASGAVTPFAEEESLPNTFRGEAGSAGSLDQSSLRLSGSVSVPGAPRSGSRYQSHEERRAAEERNYADFRARSLAELCSAKVHSARARRLAHEQQSYQAWLAEATAAAVCGKCGLAAAACSGPSSTVAVLIVSQHSFVRANIPLFACSRCNGKLFHVQPELVGAFGGTPVLSLALDVGGPDRERTWFDLRLLDTLSTLRQESPGLSIEGATSTIFRLHVDHLGEGLASVDTVRKQLGKTLEEYENVRFQRDQKILTRLEDPSLLGCCPACSAGGNNIEAPEQCHLYADGNFKLVHRSDAGTATRHAPPIQHRIAEDQAVESFCSATAARLQPAATNECSDFKADGLLTRKRAKYDITGFFGTFCRHGCLIYGLNMTTGERWSYATYILQSLMLQNIVPSFFWYDINCRFGAHFQRWVVSEVTADTAAANAAKDIKWPLPTWHHNMHNAECQAKNSFRIMRGAGRGAGEPPEAAWAYLGRFGLTQQYTSLPARQAALERTIAFWNDKKLKALPKLLLRMYRRACAAKGEAAHEANGLIQYALDQGIDVNQMVAAAQQQTAAPAPPPTALLWNEQYVYMLLRVAVLDRLTSGRVSAELLQDSASSTSRLSAVTQKVKTAEDLRRLEGQHEITERWTEGTIEFEQAFKGLCLAKRKDLQTRIAQQLQLLGYVDSLFQRMTSRRKDIRKLQSVRERQKAKIRTAAHHWHGWGLAMENTEQASDIHMYDLPPGLEQRILSRDLPWQQHVSEGVLEALAPQLRIQLDNEARSAEEERMIKTEADKAINALERQISRACAWKQELRLEIEHADAQLAVGGSSDGTSGGPERAAGQHKRRDRALGLLKLIGLKQQDREDILHRLREVYANFQSEGNDQARDPANTSEDGSQSESEEESDGELVETIHII